MSPNYFHTYISTIRLVYVGGMFENESSSPVNVIIKICLQASLKHWNNPLAEDPEQESSAMQYLHPNIPLNYPLQDTMHQIECCRTRTHEDLYSIMPYCTLGDVIEQIKKRGAMNASAARNMMTQLLDGLEFLQSHGIGHRDMSLENVVMDVMQNTSNSFKFVITDFGMAVKCPPRTDAVPPLTAASFQRIPRRDIGKFGYMAPEILFGGNFRIEPMPEIPFVNPMLSDMWALGMMLLATLTGQHPFETWLKQLTGFLDDILY